MNIQPTWEAAMPIHIEGLKSGTPQRVKLAEKGLMDLARKLDVMIATGATADAFPDGRAEALQPASTR